MNDAPRVWRLDGDVAREALEAIEEGVILHGRQQAQGSDARDIACAVYEGERLIGGAWGRTEFQRLYVQYLWVDAEFRGQGLGGDCLRRLEAQALQRGCVDALVETLLDDVAQLYEQLGYVCISHVHDFVPGFTRHTLLKIWRPRD